MLADLPELEENCLSDDDDGDGYDSEEDVLTMIETGGYQADKELGKGRGETFITTPDTAATACVSDSIQKVSSYLNVGDSVENCSKTGMIDLNNFNSIAIAI